MSTGTTLDKVDAVRQRLDTVRLQTFTDTVFRNFSATMTTLACALGDHLGLFRALAAGGPATSAELATRTGTDERCVTQWLSALTAAKYIEYEPTGNRFSLPAEHTALLTRIRAVDYSHGGSRAKSRSDRGGIAEQRNCGPGRLLSCFMPFRRDVGWH